MLENHIEALIFCAKEPIKSEEMINCLAEMFETELSIDTIEHSINALVEKYNHDSFSFGIFAIADGYQFLTKPAYQNSIATLLKQSSKKRLSTAALETLAIIAYKQPLTKSEIEQIRGVNCDYAIHKLLEKELIEMRGKSEAVGRPVLYGTTTRFMEYFGINSLKELPLPKDIALEENAIGEPAEI